MAKEGSLVTKLGSTDPAIVASALINEVNAVGMRTVGLWRKYIKLLTLAPRTISDELAREYDRIFREAIGHFIFRVESRVSTIDQNCKSSVAAQHKADMKLIKKSKVTEHIEPLPVLLLAGM